jgi:hypothetical protein
MNNVIVLFLKENLQRLFTKSPLFFQIWTIISIVLIAITGLPDFVAWLSDGGIIIPALWDEHIMKAVAWASRASLFMSLLTTQSTPMKVHGEVVKSTNVKALPFTALAEKKIVEK